MGLALLGGIVSVFPVVGDSTYHNPLKMLVFGAHPDDPETGAGGLAAKWVQSGNEVVFAYLTTGEAGIPGMSFEDAARLRTDEAKSACRILGTTPVFIGQIDGSAVADQTHVAPIVRLLEVEKPDIILTHWPIDTHLDHQVCSVLVYQAWFRLGRQQPLYYYEVMSGIQTQLFNPTDYVDMTEVADLKHEACFAHKSQGIEASYPHDHGPMEGFRGLQARVDFAEAYIRHPLSPETGVSLIPFSSEVEE